MRKLNYFKPLLLVLILLTYQLTFPIGSMIASANSMLPPSNLAAQKVTPDDVKLTWSSVSGATGYNVYEIKEGQITPLGKAAATSYNLNNLEEGSYQYVVSTLSSEGESGPSAPVSVEIAYPDMKAPGTLTHTIKNGNDIVLSWDASEYAETYHLYQISGDHKTLITSQNGRSYTISNAPEANYTYVVSAENSLYGESPLSTSLEVEVVHPVMQVPSNFTYSTTNGNDVTLKWDPVAYAKEYKIYEIIDNEKVLKHTVTSTTFKLTNMPAGEYAYEIHSSSDRFGESTKGSKQNVTVSTITMTAPENFNYKLQNINDIVLTWNSVPFTTSYKIYQILDGEKILKSTVNGTSATYANVPGGDYVYEVYSYSDRFGESAEGSRVSLNVETVTMTAPNNLKYEIQNGNDLLLSWENASNATGYKIYQIIGGEKILKSTVTGTTARYNNLLEGNYSYEVHSYSTRFGESENGSKLSLELVHPMMEPPANLEKTIKSASDFTLSWDPSDYATSYKVYQIIDGKEVLKSTVSGTSVTYTKMAPGNYSYVVYSYSTRFGESEKGSKVALTLTGLTMDAPTDLNYSIANGNDMILKWTGVQNANNYKIYQVIDGEKILQRTVSGTTATFSNMAAGEYQYEVYSNSTLFGESPEGAKLTISLAHPTMESPNNFTYKIQNGNDVVLNWQAVQYANSYKIYEVVDGEKALLRTVNALSNTISNVSEGDHTYVVHSVSNRFGESEKGSEVTLTMVHPTMEAPENLTYKIVNGNDIALDWDNVSYATSYNVYQLVNGEPVLEKTVTGSAVTFANIPEGEYTYVIHSVSNRFGESKEGSKTSIELAHPIMQAPENLTYKIVNGNDISLDWDNAAYATSYNVYLIVDGQPILDKTVTGSAVTFTNMPEGEYTYVVHSVSSRFGESIQGSKTSITLVHPIMQAPENLTQSITNGNDIVLKWNASTYATGYKVYKVVEDEAVLERTLTGRSITFANMPEGDYEYIVYSYSNRFGESPQGKPINFNLTWPIVEPPTVTGDIFNVNNIKLSWPAVTWANEYRVYKITNNERELIYKGTARTYNVNNLTEDTHSFEVTAYSNRFGESKPSNRITETIVYPVMEPPTASLTLVNETTARINWNFITYANGYNIYEVINGELVLIAEKVNNLMYTIMNLTYANHEYVVTSYSNSFGESEPSNIVLAKLILDEEAPVTTAQAPTEWVNQDQVITLSATDNETGVAKTFYSVDGNDFTEGTSFEVKGEGVHRVSFYSVDKVGNKEEAQTIEVKIDKNAPATTSDVQDIWSKEDVTVNLTAADEQSGVTKTYYSINGSEYIEGTSFVVETEGLNLVSFYSVDKVGNKEEAQTIEVKIDKTASATTSDAQDIWSKEDVTVNLTAVDEQSGVAKTYYSINGSKYVEGTSFVVETEGLHLVSFYSLDNAGNKEEPQTISVKVDQTAPVTTSDAPETWSTDDVTVYLEASDRLSGVATTFYSINGSEYKEGTSFTLTDEGIHEVSFFSIDNANNIEGVKTLEVKIDKTAPEVSMDVNEEYALDSALPLLYTAKDTVSEVISEKMIVTAPGESSGKEVQNGSSISLDKPGVYNITVVATNAGGLTTEIHKQFVVYIPATIEVTPKVIKGNKGIFTVRVDVPKPFDPKDFDLDTAKVNGVHALTSNKGYYNQAKLGQFKFERSDFIWDSSEETLVFRGYLEGNLVIGQTTVKVQK
ncbi:fibronectin type III domain-containing protein [Metabacillus halosaccharovorans]|uniref:fibronectin type III domain-containing protein n=1 Tax=Metabacillus halosaccharovorans TaxID=930124 RepID=UPI001C200B22|nr:fibronectin type III domain-containing protein [Metabacillus halosaccharovorans]MBU7594576.1 fibronectin type III domain-containing protein [Metabacillus halosaccharovorans]